MQERTSIHFFYIFASQIRFTHEGATFHLGHKFSLLLASLALIITQRSKIFHLVLEVH